MADDRQRAREATREWIRATTGILAAFKEAIEETIDELRERGDLSPERAKEAVRTTMDRAQQAMAETRERIDFVPRREFDALRSRLDDIERRVAQLEGRSPSRTRPVEDEKPPRRTADRTRGPPAVRHSRLRPPRMGGALPLVDPGNDRPG